MCLLVKCTLFRRQHRATKRKREKPKKKERERENQKVNDLLLISQLDLQGIFCFCNAQLIASLLIADLSHSPPPFAHFSSLSVYLNLFVRLDLF